MTRRTVQTFLLVLAIAGAMAGATRVLLLAGTTVNLTMFATSFNNPIGIDFHETLDELIVSVNWITGMPNNLDTIAGGGAHTPFAHPAPGFAGREDELKVATVRSGPCMGNFEAGDVFVGNGMPGQIALIRNNGTTVIDPWVTLPGETGHIRGSMFQDRYCAFGGDLIVVTGNSQPVEDVYVGNVWRVRMDASQVATPTLVASLHKHLEGVITVPNDVAKYGPMAGRILVGDEDRSSGPHGDYGKIFAIRSADDIFMIAGVIDPFYGYPTYLTNHAIHPEDLDFVPESDPSKSPPGTIGDGRFFGVDYGNGRILTAPISEFADYCGDLLVTREYPNIGTPLSEPGGSGLSILRWVNGNPGHFEVVPLTTPDQSASQWEHVTFRGGADCRVCTGTIGDLVWNDLDNDGIQDAGEPGIPGVKVTLTMPSVPGWSESVDTDAGGHYLFTGLCPGDYVVTLTVPAGETLTTALAGPDRSKDSNENGKVVTLTPENGSDLTIDFGLTGFGIIGDLVWKDLDCDGVQEAGEPGLGSVVVHLKAGAGQSCSDPDLATKTTSGAGIYQFDHLNPGGYTVCVDAPAGYLASPPHATGSDLDSDTGSAGVTLPNGSPASHTDNTIDFGFCPPPPPACSGQIGDFVWQDTNADGTQTGESGNGIPNVTVKLTKPDASILTTTTNASGQYLFTGLCAGTYTVEVDSSTVPAGWSPTSVNLGGNPANDSNPSPSMVTLLTDWSQDLTIDFGYIDGLPLCPADGSGSGGSGSAGTLFWNVLGNGDVYVRYDQNRAINDNTYGTNAIGWSSGHTFSNLTGSDKAEFRFTAAGSPAVVLDFYMDYVSAKSGTPSGYASLGPDGGDGSMVSGLRSNILSFNTSLAKNLNTYCTAGNCTVQGVNLLANSPPASSSYVPANAFFNNWNFTDSFEMTISHLAFGSAGFGTVSVGVVHNSPAKSGSNAITPEPCVPTGGGTCSLSSSSPVRSSRQVKMNVTNSGSSAVRLSGLSVTWPSGNGKLRKVILGSKTVWSAGATCCSATISSLSGTTAERSINAGATKTLIFEFEKNAVAGSYSWTVSFGNCSITRSPSPLASTSPNGEGVLADNRRRGPLPPVDAGRT